MRYTVPYICLLLIGLFTSCEQSYVVDVDDVEQSVVVHSIFSPDQPIAVRLTYSRSIFEKQDFKSVDDAQVVITDLTAGRDIAFEHSGDGWYMADSVTALAGHQYELSLLTRDRQEITARSYVPNNIEVVINEVQAMQEDGEPVLKIDFDIIEDQARQNYYVWDIIAPEEDTPSDINEQYTDWLAGGNVNTGHNRYRPHWKTFHADTDVSSPRVQSSIIARKADERDSQGGGEETDPDDEDDGSTTTSQDTAQQASPVIQLRVQAVSKSLYDYYQSLDRYNRNGGLNTSYATPLQLYTNIEGGYGVFAGYNENIIIIE